MARRPKRQYRRKGGRRAMGRYIKGNVEELFSLTTLAPATVVGTSFDESVNERTYVSSIKATYSMTGYTKATDDGPILVGVAHGDYTDAEIEAWIENTGSWDEGNLVQQKEVGQRLIRKIGIFDNPASASESVSLNDGKPLKTKLSWILNQGQTLRLWAYNKGTSALGTTVPVINVDGHVNLWPR